MPQVELVARVAVPADDAGAGRRREPGEPELAEHERVAGALLGRRPLAAEHGRQERVDEAERDLRVVPRWRVARVAEHPDRATVGFGQGVLRERRLVVVIGGARAVDAQDDRQVRAVRQQIDVGRRERRVTPAVRPAVVAMDDHEAPLVPCRGDVRAVAIPRERRLLERRRQVGAVVELQRVRVGTVVVDAVDGHPLADKAVAYGLGELDERPVLLTVVDLAGGVGVLELCGHQRARQHRPGRRRRLVRDDLRDRLVDLREVVAEDPPDGDVGQLVSVVLRRVRVVGWDPARRRGERRNELVVADDRHVARPDAQGAGEPAADIRLDLCGRGADLTGQGAGLAYGRQVAHPALCDCERVGCGPRRRVGDDEKLLTTRLDDDRALGLLDHRHVDEPVRDTVLRRLPRRPELVAEGLRTTGEVHLHVHGGQDLELVGDGVVLDGRDLQGTDVEVTNLPDEDAGGGLGRHETLLAVDLVVDLEGLCVENRALEVRRRRHGRRRRINGFRLDRKDLDAVDRLRLHVARRNLDRRAVRNSEILADDRDGGRADRTWSVGVGCDQFGELLAVGCLRHELKLGQVDAYFQAVLVALKERHLGCGKVTRGHATTAAPGLLGAQQAPARRHRGGPQRRQATLHGCAELAAHGRPQACALERLAVVRHELNGGARVG